MAYEKLGDVQLGVGDTEAALANYQRALEVVLGFAERDPSNSQSQWDVVLSIFQLGVLLEQHSDPAVALEHFGAAHQKATWMNSEGMAAPDDYRIIQILEERLEGIEAE